MRKKNLGKRVTKCIQLGREEKDEEEAEAEEEEEEDKDGMGKKNT